MTSAEYIELLWRVIYAFGFIIAGLIAAVWRHVIEDRKTRVELERCKLILGLNDE